MFSLFDDSPYLRRTAPRIFLAFRVRIFVENSFAKSVQYIVHWTRSSLMSSVVPSEPRVRRQEQKPAFHDFCDLWIILTYY